MIRAAITRAALLLALAAPLGGCVAAVIPALAVSGLAGREVLDRDGEAQAHGRPAVVSAPAPLAPAPAPVSARAGPAAAGFAPALASPAAQDRFAPFRDYALAQVRIDPVDGPRRSAVLTRPAALSLETGDCSIRTPSVVIDLDPVGGTFDPLAATAPDPALADTLEVLRAEGVDVFWISALSETRTAAVRDHLRASGLDPAGEDSLLLMRGVEDRKQLRRRAIAESHCVVAILGDGRGDFDELFDYLRDPAAATSLEPMFGAGWFIVANPIAAKDD